jgi:ABC-type phosphate transport system substrate-binding protein
MKARTLVSTLALVAATAASTAFPTQTSRAQTAALVVAINDQADVQSLTKAELRGVYLGNVSFWEGNVRVRLFTRPTSSRAGRAFLQRIMQMTPSRFRQHWMQRQLSGQGVAPTSIGSARDLVERVSQTAGGIGFLLPEEATGLERPHVRLITIR